MAEETNISKSTDSIHIYDVIMRAVTKLPDKEKEVLLNHLSIQQLTYLLSSKENLNAYMKSIVDSLEWLNSLSVALNKVCKAMKESLDESDDIVSNYDKLSSDKKKEATLKLMNNSAFQKDCCEILVNDMERIVKEDSTVKAINDVFNITGWYKTMIKRGIGINHEYKG